MAKSKKTTDWLGNEKEEHFDDKGHKTGETRYEKDWLGNQVQKHVDVEGNTRGHTKAGSDWIGRSRAEHVNKSGERIGTSRNETDWLGRPVQRHYDTSGVKVGQTTSENDWFGRPFKKHDGKYFKSAGAENTERTAVTYSTSGYSSAGSSVSKAAKGLLVLAICLLLLGGLTSLLMRSTFLTAGPAGPALTLQQAQTIIPQDLNTIYQSLNGGDPHAAAGLIAPQLLTRPDQLDRICRRSTYRAHYVQAIISRSDGLYEARVRALFQPEEERADIFLFEATKRQLVLQTVDSLPAEWLRSEKERALSCAQRFIHAASAGKKTTLVSMVSPNLDISPLFENEDYVRRLRDVNSSSIAEAAAGFKQHDGLKVDINITTGRKRFCGDLWHFLVDPTGKSDKIVEWEFVPIFGCYSSFGPPNIEKHIDPKLEQYTLSRFGLLGKKRARRSSPTGGATLR